MQKMYQDYKDIADFRLVYINEAHAADSNRAVGYAKEMNITEHKNYGQRCQTAEKLLGDKSLTIPTLIDGMDNVVNEAYQAHPDRIFVVRKDGKLAIAAKRGPWGFKPAINATKTFLASYRETGIEPEPVETGGSPNFAGRNREDDLGPDAVLFKDVLGDWVMTTQFGAEKIPATMKLTEKDGHVVGVWESRGREGEITDLKLEGKKLFFKRTIGRGPEFAFTGTVEGSSISGSFLGIMGKLDCTGERKQ